MGNKLKYIIVEVSDGEATEILPVLFPDSLIHREIYRGVKGSYCGVLGRAKTTRCVSAGFVRIDESMSLSEESIKVSGKSETLDLESRPEDAKLIYIMLTKSRHIVYEAEALDNMINT